MTRHLSIAAAVVLLVVSSEIRPLGQAGADEALVKRARAIHDRVITLDTHDDINPENFTRQKNYTQRLETQVNLPKMVEGGLDASFFIVYVGQGELTPAGYDSAYKQAVAKFDAVHHLTKEIAPGQIELALTAADVPADRQVGQEGRADRHRERVFARHRPQAHQGVLRPRRPLHVARAQRPQPVRRLEHRRARRQVAAQRPERARQAGDCRDEQVGHHGRPFAPVETGEPAGHGAVEGAGDRVAFGRARAGRSQPQHGRRAVDGAQEERRRDSDGGVCELREDQQARFAGAHGRDSRRCATSSAWPRRAAVGGPGTVAVAAAAR